jgi:hypothetical protein
MPAVNPYVATAVAIAASELAGDLFAKPDTDTRVDLSEGTRPKFDRASLAPLKGFELSPCTGGTLLGGFAVAAKFPEVARAYLDDDGTPLSYNAAYSAQVTVLASQFGGLRRKYCGPTGECHYFLGGVIPDASNACIDAVARQWIGLVDQVISRPELGEKATPGPVISGLLGAAAAFIPDAEPAPGRDEIAGLRAKLQTLLDPDAGAEGKTLGSLESFPILGAVKGVILGDLAGETGRQKRAQEVWGLVSRIATRLDAAFNLTGEAKVTLGREVTDRAGKVAGGIAGAVGGVLGDVVGGLLLSNLGALVVLGGAAYLVLRR